MRDRKVRELGAWGRSEHGISVGKHTTGPWREVERARALSLDGQSVHIYRVGASRRRAGWKAGGEGRLVGRVKAAVACRAEQLARPDFGTD